MYWVAVRRALNGCMNTGCSLMLRDIVDCANVGIPHPPVNDTDVANGNVGGGTIPIVPFKAKAAQGARTHSAYPLFPGCQELGAPSFLAIRHGPKLTEEQPLRRRTGKVLSSARKDTRGR